MRTGVYNNYRALAVTPSDLAKLKNHGFVIEWDANPKPVTPAIRDTRAAAMEYMETGTPLSVLAEKYGCTFQAISDRLARMRKQGLVGPNPYATSRK